MGHGGPGTPVVVARRGPEDDWSARLLEFRRAADAGDAEQLRTAQKELRERGEQHGLQPDEAQLLGQINMAVGED